MDLDASAVWDFAREVVTTLRPGRGRTLATVTRVDPDGTTWVTTGDGGEAPASTSSAGAAVGDTVEVGWDGSSMSVRANVSNPAPDGNVVSRAITQARGIAEAAQRVASAVNQHFWTDGAGIHVTQVTQEEWTDADRATYHSGPNVLINSIGQLFRDGLNNLLTMTTEDGARAMAVWDGLGNGAANILAYFGEIVRIGRVGEAHVEVDEGRMRIMQDTDRLYAVEADGISVSIYAGGSTKASGANYTVAYEQALLDWLNRNCTVEDGVVYDSNGVDTGMTYDASTRYVLDPSGKRYSTAYAEAIFYNESEQVFYDMPRLIPMSEVPTAPTHIEMGGVGIDMANNGLSLYASNLKLDKDGNVTRATDVSWTALTLDSAVEAYDYASTPRYSRWGNVVQVLGAIKVTSEVASGGTFRIGSLPEGCRPTQELDIICQGTGNHVWLMKIYVNGTVNGSRYHIGANNDSIPTTAWLAFSATFIIS